MNGRSSFDTPNRARTRPSESSISISPALMTRFLMLATSLPGRRPDAMSLGPRVSRRARRSAERPRRGRATNVDRQGRSPRAERPGLEDRTDPGCEKPPRPEGRSGLSSRTGRPFEPSSGGERFCHSFSSRSDRTVTDSRIEPVGVDADARAGGDGHRAVGRELERLGEVLVEVAAARARVAGEPEVRHRREREIRRPPDPVSSIPPHQTGTERSAVASCTLRASSRPPTRPCFTFTIRQEPSPIAARASAAERIDSSGHVGRDPWRWARRAPTGRPGGAAARP